MRSTVAGFVVLAVGLLGGAREAYADPPETARQASSSDHALSPIAIAGAITFALSYGPNFVIGATDTALDCTIGLLFEQCEVNPLVIPVAGPFIYAEMSNSSVSPTFASIHEEKALLMASGIVQAASIALMTVGLATSSAKRSPSRIGSLRPAPVLHPSTTGIALVGEL